MTERKIGAFICGCGGNISDYVDVEKVRDEIEKEPGVEIAKTAMFTCSDATQREIIDLIREKNLDQNCCRAHLERGQGRESYWQPSRHNRIQNGQG